MSVIQLHIVGFPYRKDIAGHVSEFLAEVPGHVMTLRPHQGNDHDKLAVRAIIRFQDEKVVEKVKYGLYRKMVSELP